MGKIEVYKIGFSNLNKDKDANAAYHEYELINSTLKKYTPKHDLFVIIGGKFPNTYSHTMLLKKIDELKQSNWTIIFIATDEIVFTDNTEIIRKSDVLLHQSDRIIKELPCKHQFYNWIPELFYESKPRPMVQSNDLCFGGGTRGNEDIITSYIKELNMDVSLKTKTEDNRMTARDYHKWQANHAFAFVISRKSYQRIGWVTARFVEAISDWCYPIPYITYDMDRHFEYVYKGVMDAVSPYVEKNYVSTPSTAQAVIDRMSQNSYGRVNALRKMRQNLRKVKYNFLSVIAMIDSGDYDEQA